MNEFLKKEEKGIVKVEKIKMPKNYFFKFVELLKCQSNHQNEKIITHYVTKELDRMNLAWEIDPSGNILVTKGESEFYPCVASHLDTVHDFVNDFKIVELNGNLIAKSGDKLAGIGGDDKCGVFGCLYLLEKYQNIKAVFFTSEEVGCIGAYQIDMNFFKDCGFILEIDRKGYGDFIDRYWGNLTTNGDFDLATEDVQTKYGYKSEYGLCTDSLTLFERKVGISCVNMSCGYYNPHKNDEYINVNEFWKSLQFADEMIKALGEKSYPAFPEEKKYNVYNDWANDDWYDSIYRNKQNVPERYTNGYGTNTSYTNTGGNIYHDDEYPSDYESDGSYRYSGYEEFWNGKSSKAKVDVIHDDDVYGTWYRIPD